jgi:hypothetical protein
MKLRPLLFFVVAAIVTATGFSWLTSANASHPNADIPLETTPYPPPANVPLASDDDLEWGQPVRTIHPKASCEERVAYRIGHRADLRDKLELRAEQTAFWDAFEKASEEANAKDRARCAALPEEREIRPDFTERVKMQKYVMKARLSYLEIVEPSMLALYAELTPEQKATFARSMTGLVRRP